MKVCFALLFVLQGVLSYEFRNSITQQNPAAPKFNPTYVQTLDPINDNVLTTDTLNAPLQNPSTYWTDGWAYVVAVGPSANSPTLCGTTTICIKEGDIVLVNPCSQRVNLNPATGNAPPEAGVYCIYSAASLLGKISQGSYGANRNFKWTSRIEKSAGKMFGSTGTR